VDEELGNPYPDAGCFFCGRDNPHGLHLRFRHDAARGETSTTYVPETRFVGQGDILHGGIQMGLLDETMGWSCFAETGEMAVTETMEVRFARPVYIAGDPVRVTCRLTGRQGRKVHLRAELADGQGTVCTIATGTYHIVAPEKYEALIHATGEATDRGVSPGTAPVPGAS
jgi:uncharacterized protein (TIGR00369 family)